MNLSSSVCLDPKSEQSAIWCVQNKRDKRILITYSNIASRGVTNLLHKLYYRTKELPKQLIQDYLDGLLEVQVVEYVQKIERGDLLAEILKAQYIELYKAAGYSLYNKNTPLKLFVSLVAVKQQLLSGSEEMMSVFALLKPKQKAPNLAHHTVVGAFSSFPEAKQWCKEYYGAYEHENAKQLVICSNADTRSYYKNPLVQDGSLASTYRKVFQLT